MRSLILLSWESWYIMLEVFDQVKTISWIQATTMSVIAWSLSFFSFLLIQVIFGDILSEILIKEYESMKYFNINFILYLGLFFMLIISFSSNWLLFREYSANSKLIINIFTLFITIIILFFISWLSIVIRYPELYFNLSILEKMQLSLYFFALFSIYILPNPVLFWQVALIIYHLILIIFLKFFLMKKTISITRSSKKKRKSGQKENVLRKYDVI